jgi:hypothetical protein
VADLAVLHVVNGAADHFAGADLVGLDHALGNHSRCPAVR